MTVEREGGRVRVGVLAIQGAVDRHLAALDDVGAEGRRVLHEEDLQEVSALILPGGETTTITKGLDRLGLYEPIQHFVQQGGALLGTCAGAILLARECRNHPVETLALLDATAARNAYGTQVDSFSANADAGGDAAFEGIRCVFIRAPQLEDPGPGVEVLVRVDGLPVLVREGRILAATFHPELTPDRRVHRALLDLAEAS